MSIELIEEITVKGIIKIHEWPADWTVEDIVYWTLPETDGHGNIIRPARMSAKEIERYQVREYPNILTNAGRNALLAYGGMSGATTQGWAQYLAIGVGNTNQVFPTDPILNAEFYRQVPTSNSIVGNQNDIATVIAANTAAGLYTEYGLFGKNATASANTGEMHTHAAANPSYNKSLGVGVTIDYLISVT